MKVQKEKYSFIEISVFSQSFKKIYSLNQFEIGIPSIGSPRPSEYSKIDLNTLDLLKSDEKNITKTDFETNHIIPHT